MHAISFCFVFVTGQHCSALKDLNISRLRVSNKAMQRFSSKVPHLKVSEILVLFCLMRKET